MKILFRIMFGAGLGAYIFVSLGKHLSDNPIALVIWMIIGAFIGFIAVKPRAYFVALKEERRKYIERKRYNEITRLRAEEARRIADIPFATIYRLDAINRRWSSLLGLAVCLWIAVMVWHIPTVARPGDEMLLSTFLAALFAFLGICCAVLEIDLDRSKYSKIDKEDRRVMKGVEEKLRKEIRENRKMALLALVLPLSLLGFILYIVVIRPLIHIGDTIYAIGLILAKAARSVASLEGWLAAVGTVIGGITGWVMGKDELLGMFVGALVGGTIFALAKLSLMVLPDPAGKWPEALTSF